MNNEVCIYDISESIIGSPQQSTTTTTTVNDCETGEETELIVNQNGPTTAKPITFFRAWFLPGVFMVKRN
jgi:hypothetical protein